MPVSFVTPSTIAAISSPKRSRDLLDRGGGVLDGVVQQRRAQRLGVQAHARADARHADRVHDEVLAGLAPLRGVVLAGEHERVLHAGAVDLDGRVRGVLGDDREQVAQQPALQLVEIQTRRDRLRSGLLHLDDSRGVWICGRGHGHRVGDCPPGLKRVTSSEQHKLLLISRRLSGAGFSGAVDGADEAG